MKALIVVCLVVAATLAEQKDIIILKDYYANPHHDRSDIRIVGGLPAEVGQFPWQVVLLVTDGDGTHLCSGSLIDNQWIVTAAHCSDGAFSFSIHLGRTSLSNQEEDSVTVVSTDYVIHPDYSYRTLNNDIALIRLPEPVSFNDRISPIRLPQLGEVVPVGSGVTVSGWGQISDQPGSISNDLIYANLTVISNSECVGYFGSVFVVDSTVCAIGNPHHGFCNGDSGGPLVLTTEEGSTLHGVASFVSGSGCASSDPSGFVRVEAVRNWINEVTGV